MSGSRVGCVRTSVVPTVARVEVPLTRPVKVLNAERVSGEGAREQGAVGE
jgi:hypothetical protein